jgi:peptidoglycan/xylan/chitin deacetylase (PgdA/CDA1 family)
MSGAAASAWAQDAKPATPPAAAQTKCDNPNALGVSRVVQIDTTGAPGFGFEHFKAYDFLKEKEVVLTFDDGPWPVTTERVLKALEDQCTKALFFTIGQHASWHPEIIKRVKAAGHTVGTHTWSHKDLSPLSEEDAKAEIEKGIAAVSISLGNKPVDPFFRFPALKHPPTMMKYVATRNLYKVVQIVGKTPVEPLEEYKKIVIKEIGGGLADARPMSNVIKTISGN